MGKNEVNVSSNSSTVWTKNVKPVGWKRNFCSLCPLTGEKRLAIPRWTFKMNLWLSDIVFAVKRLRLCNDVAVEEFARRFSSGTLIKCHHQTNGRRCGNTNASDNESRTKYTCGVTNRMFNDCYKKGQHVREGAKNLADERVKWHRTIPLLSLLNLTYAKKLNSSFL